MVIIVVFWFFWYAIHSLLASLCVKRFIMARIPQIFPYYRLVYNMVALLTLIPVLYIHARQPDVIVFTASRWLTFGGYLLIGLGIVLLIVAMRSYDFREFLGFAEMNEFRRRPSPLSTSGLNSRMRHPLYTASLIVITGYLLTSLTLNTIGFAVISIGYIVIGSELEERKLIKRYNEQYRAYQKRVRRFFPFP